MLYNKCSATSFGYQSTESSLYTLCGICIINKRSWYVFDFDLKPSAHCYSISTMAFNRSSLLLKGFHSTDVALLVHLYKMYMQPLLENNSTQVWNPWLHKDIQCIVRVQRYFTRAIYKRAGIPRMDCGRSLTNLGLQSLECRRVFSCAKATRSQDTRME